MALVTNPPHRLEIQDVTAEIKATAAERLSEMITLYGPVPRNIYRAAITPTSHANNLTHALESLTYSALVNAVHSATTNPSTLSDQLILIKRDNLPTTEVDEDTLLLDFPSDYIAWLVMQRLLRAEFCTEVPLLSLFRTPTETSSTSGCRLFEALAHRILTFNDWMALSPLKKMKSTPTAPRTFSIEIPKDASVGPSKSLYLPIRRCQPEFYHDIHAIIPAVGKTYAIPPRRDNPLFDSLLFGPNPLRSPPDLSASYTSVEPSPKRRRLETKRIYAIKMVTSPTHMGSETGLQDLLDLQDLMPGIQFAFVLVLPLSRRNRTITWEMSPSWPWTNSGVEVYCQEICTVSSETIFGSNVADIFCSRTDGVMPETLKCRMTRTYKDIHYFCLD